MSIEWGKMQRSIDIKSEIPIATDEQVQNIIRKEINAVRKRIESPFIHLSSSSYGGGSRLDYKRDLFSFTAEELSNLEGDVERDDKYSRGEVKKWRVESDRLQRLGLKIMKEEYGLDESISQPVHHNRDWTKDGTIDNGDGTMSEMRLYPKTAIDGLAFERFIVFDKTTGNILSVYWNVVDNAPFRINWGKKTKSKLNPVPTV